jgi:hypothetical protein
MADETAIKASETSAQREKPAAKEQARTPPKLRYQDIPDLPETFADSIGQWIFDGQNLRIEFTVTRLDPGGSRESADRPPASRRAHGAHAPMRGGIDPAMPAADGGVGKGRGQCAAGSHKTAGAVRLDSI